MRGDDNTVVSPDWMQQAGKMTCDSACAMLLSRAAIGTNSHNKVACHDAKKVG